MNQTQILLATANPDKQQQFRWLLEGLPLTPVTPQDLGLTSVPDEVGESHHAVARLKARMWSQSGSMLAIASDGGLVLPALGAAWESLYTHRFAGETATGEDRVRNLLEMLLPYRGEDRRASWLESLAIAHRGLNPGVLGIGGGDRKNRRRDAQRIPGTGRVLGFFRLGVSPPGQDLQPAFHPGAGLSGRPLGAFEAIRAEVFPGLLCAANGLSYNGLLNSAGKRWGAAPSPRARR